MGAKVAEGHDYRNSVLYRLPNVLAKEVSEVGNSREAKRLLGGNSTTNVVKVGEYKVKAENKKVDLFADLSDQEVIIKESDNQLRHGVLDHA